MLDLARVNQQISRMAVEQQMVVEDRLKRLDKALGQLVLESGRLPGFMRKLQASKTSWLLAGIRESLENTYALPPRPLAITVVATDGSQIAPSHHEVIPAFLLNISTVVLHYGTGERAALSSTPTLFYRDEDLYTDYGGQRVQVTGDLLGMLRTLMECQALLRQATRAQESGHRTCALSDGSLILWQLEGKPRDYKQANLACYLGSLEQARQQQIPVAGYISRPRSRMCSILYGLASVRRRRRIVTVVPISICHGCHAQRLKGSATGSYSRASCSRASAPRSLKVDRVSWKTTVCIALSSSTCMWGLKLCGWKSPSGWQRTPCSWSWSTPSPMIRPRKVWAIPSRWRKPISMPWYEVPNVTSFTRW